MLDAAAAPSFPGLARRAIDADVIGGSTAALHDAALLGAAIVAADWFVVAAQTVHTARTGERVLRPDSSRRPPRGRLPVASGAASVDELTAFVLYLALLFGPTQQLSQAFDGCQQPRVGLQRIGDVLRTPTSVAQRAGAQHVAGRLHGTVELRGVSFRCAGVAEDALHDIHLSIPAGSTVALVGETGG
ncbi:MAG: hypothetical protein ACXVXN_10230, partial [Mycobacteriaceae bacterium]